MRKVLVIGGAGFIGSAIVHRLLNDKNYTVYVVEPERASIDRLSDVHEHIIILRTDIKNTVEIHECLKNNKIDTIIHLASTLIPSSTIYAYQNEINEVVLPTLNIIKIASQMDIKFVYFSSGGTIYGNKDTGIFKETDSLNPISYYGLSKLLLEETILFEKRTSGLQYLILRPSNPYGPGQNINGRQGIIAVSIGKIINNEPITVWGDGTVIRDFIYIEDLAEIVYKLIEKGVEGQIINIGSGVGYSINEIISYIESHLGQSAEIKYEPGRNVDVPAMILDVKKLSMFCPFKLKNIDEGIKMFVNDIKKGH